MGGMNHSRHAGLWALVLVVSTQCGRNEGSEPPFTPVHLKGAQVSLLTYVGDALCTKAPDGTVSCEALDASSSDPGVLVQVPALAGASALGGSALPEPQICGLLADQTLRCVPRAALSAAGATVATGVASVWGRCWILTDGSAACLSEAEAGGAVPVPLDGAKARQIAAAVPVCVLLDGGTVRCWPADLSGSGADIAELTGAKQISIYADLISYDDGGWRDNYHGCALLDGGAARCWGMNEFGQLGDGTRSDNPVAVTVLSGEDQVALSGAREVCAGAQHSCALMESGRVRCWGHSGAFAGKGFEKLTATEVDDVSKLTTILCGPGLDCGIREDGSVLCWGGYHLAADACSGGGLFIPGR